MLKKMYVMAIMMILPIAMMAQTKFGHVNSQDVITAMPEFKKAQADLETMSKKYEDEITRTREEFNKKYQEFIKQQEQLPKNIAERRQKELQDMAQRQEQFQQEVIQSMQKAQQDALAPILKKVNDAITAIGKAEGFTYIFDISQVPIAYVGATSVDITPKLKAKVGIK